jgi:lysophospholipase L1-like esterase
MTRRLLVVAVMAACGGGGDGDDGDASAAADAPPGTVDAPPGTPDAAVPVAEVHLIGRFADDGSFAWPGSAIAARFAGTELTISLDDGGNWFDVTIDGVAQPVLVGDGSGTYQLASGLAPGEHDVVITRRTESFFGVSRWGGFPGATLVPTAGPARLIEFVGDSITCGYGVLGDGPSCPFDAATESEPDAWGGRAARALDAAHTAIAYSGKGVYRNFGGEPGVTMPAHFELTFADDPSSQWSFSYVPDAVVVNLGTNDFSTGDPGQPFVDAYDDFVQQLRGHYPAAHLVLAASPMLGGADHDAHAQYLMDLVAAAAARGDTNVSFLPIATQDLADGLGCDYHPGTVTAQEMADALVDHLRARLGW